TGCAFEERQLESLAALHNALAVFMPIAWHMLLLRGVARDAPATAADRVLSPTHLRLLQTLARPRNKWGLRLSRKPTARDVLFAIARLGGHLPNNGTPVWLTLRRGYDELFKLEAAASA